SSWRASAWNSSCSACAFIYLRSTGLAICRYPDRLSTASRAAAATSLGHLGGHVGGDLARLVGELSCAGVDVEDHVGHRAEHMLAGRALLSVESCISAIFGGAPVTSWNLHENVLP